jgi:hypothetical protein
MFMSKSVMERYLWKFLVSFLLILNPVAKVLEVDGLSVSSCDINRRRAVRRVVAHSASTIASLLVVPSSSLARAPGSKDISASVEQIQDAAQDLRKLERDWGQYAIIDAEGRAGSTDGARRVLGGIAPQAGSAAIVAAKSTPLYRIDVAFITVRKAVLEDSEEWTTTFDLERFEELADRLVYEIQKADGNFYGVLFAAKGTKMINDIFVETKNLVQQGIIDLEEMTSMLKEAGAPGSLPEL